MLQEINSSADEVEDQIRDLEDEKLKKKNNPIRTAKRKPEKK